MRSDHLQQRTVSLGKEVYVAGTTMATLVQHGSQANERHRGDGSEGGDAAEGGERRPFGDPTEGVKHGH
eukprot:16135262-Heterocapsa_arctica.AAC.1